MAAYRVLIPPKVKQQIAVIAEPFRRRIMDAAVALADNPRPHGAVKLKGNTGEYRIRIGDYRVIYLIEDRTITVTVNKVSRRDDAYRKH